MKALTLEPYLHIAINPYNIDFVPELMGKTTLPILEPHGWEMKKENIESMFKRVEKIREMLV